MTNYLRKITPAYLLLSSFCTWSQVNIPGTYEDKKDTTNLIFYESVEDKATQKIIGLVDPFFRASFNSTYPRGYNDGPVWKGKGITTEIHAGISGSKGVFSYTLYPVVCFSQNSSFDLAPQNNQNISPFRYQFAGGIDWVQQYGSDPFVNFHPGQSELKLHAGKFIASISTQNYSVGPSVFNPIVLSRQGGGFPHVRIGSDPLDLKIKKLNIGKLEANFLVGLLRESEYFDNNTLNDTRYFNGLFLGYSPSFLPNLTIGFNRTLYKNTQFFEPLDIISAIKILDSGVRGDSINTNDTFDQLASATIEWKFPDIGFRAYAEFAKNDFTGSFRWTILEPEHSRAYTVGFEKTTKLKNTDLFSVIYEHTNLSRNHTYLWRAEPTFYVHHINRQGYTHNGQILGAGIGPGSNSDILELNYIHDGMIFGISAQRIEFNKDYFATQIQGVGNHDVEYSFGGSFQYELPKLVMAVEGIFSENYNRYYIETNVNVYLEASTKIKIN